MLLKKTVFICVSFILLFIAGVFALQTVDAQTTNAPVTGATWSSNYGWIVFNPTNSSGSARGGVTIDSNGDFSGYAWANPHDQSAISPTNSVGWISFEETSGCPTSPCRPHVDFSTGAVTGFAKVISTGEWIALSPATYGGVTYNPATKTFGGYAWGAQRDSVSDQSYGAGWINLSASPVVCTNCASAIAVTCAATPTTATNADVVTWTATVTGQAGTYTYAWSGTDSLIGTSASVTKTYATAGAKTANVTVTLGSAVVTADCSEAVTVTELPTTGTVSISRVGENGLTGSAPASTFTKFNESSASSQNPNQFLNQAPSGEHTSYTTDLSNYTETVATCSYLDGQTECTPTNFSSTICSVDGYCAHSMTVTAGYVTKVDFKYTYVPPTAGTLDIVRVGADGFIASAPAGTFSVLSPNAATAANPAYNANISTGSKSTLATDLSSEYDITAAVCDYAEGAGGCDIDVDSDEFTPATCGTVNGYCSKDATVIAGRVTKVVFKYAPKAPTTGSIRAIRVGTDGLITSAPANTGTRLGIWTYDAVVNDLSDVAPGSYTSIGVTNPISSNVGANPAGEYDVSVATCPYAEGGTECNISSSYSPVLCSNGLCTTSINIVAGEVTKVAFKYTPKAPSAGTLNIIRVGADGYIASAPAETFSVLAPNTANAANPLYNANISTGNKYTLATDLSGRYDVHAAVCTYAEGATACTIDANSSEFTLATCGTVNGYCSKDTSVSAGRVTNVFFKYGPNTTTGPRVTLTANPTSVVSGGASNLTWATTNVTGSCTASGGWSGSKANTGGTESTGALTASTLFTLTCPGANGSSAVANVTVTLSGEPSGGIRIVRFGENAGWPSTAPETTAGLSNYGDSSTDNPLDFNGIPVNTYEVFVSDKTADGYEIMAGTCPYAVGAEDCVVSTFDTPLNCTEGMCYMNVGVDENFVTKVAIVYTPSVDVPSLTLTANPMVVSMNESTTLSWTSNLVTNCVASDGWSGSKAETGSEESPSISEDTTFTLTCTQTTDDTLILSSITVRHTPQCSDNVNNDDGDNLIDEQDPGCYLNGIILENGDDPVSNGYDADDDSEINVFAACSNNTDDDEDGKIDADDPGCYNNEDISLGSEGYLPLKNSELNGVCSNSSDDDGDGKIDAADPGCHIDDDMTKAYVPADTSEVNIIFTQCSDRVDNTDPEDTIADYPSDEGCTNLIDEDETNVLIDDNEDPPQPPRKSQCSDGIDNDDPEDTKYDFNSPNPDPGCTSAGDDNEVDEGPTCANGIDDDANGVIDNSEECSNPQCSDGRDNDYDGKTDYTTNPATRDTGCDDTSDDSEYSVDVPPICTELDNCSTTSCSETSPFMCSLSPKVDIQMRLYPSGNFNAAGPLMIDRDDQIEIKWKITGSASACYATPDITSNRQWYGYVNPLGGTKIITPGRSMDFRITCLNAFGSGTDLIKAQVVRATGN